MGIIHLHYPPPTCMDSTDLFFSVIADPSFPTPEAALNAPREKLGPRQVRGAMFTYVTPEGGEPYPEILAVSDSAMVELGLKVSEKTRLDFLHVMAGNSIMEDIMPWAASYGGMFVPH